MTTQQYGGHRSKSGYDNYLEEEGIPVHRGWYIEDARNLELRPWKRFGVNGAFIQMNGQEYITGMEVLEIPPRGASNWQHHMFEKIYYVMQGSGTTEVQSPKGGTQTLTWTKGDLSGVPLNSTYRMVNDFDAPALLLVQTTAPLAMDLYHSPTFVFDCDFKFTDRYDGDPEYFAVHENFSSSPRGGDDRRGGGTTWVTNVIRDSDNVSLPAGRWKSADYRIMSYNLVGNTLEGHFAQWPAGQYNKGHAHGGGAILYIVTGHGYSLMWPRDAGVRPYEAGNEDKVVRAPWQEGAIISPGAAWFHQHFGVGSDGGKPVRQLAMRPSGGQHPLGFRSAVSSEGPTVSIKEGGTLVDFDLEDPRIRADFKAEIAAAGVPYLQPAEEAI